MATFLGCNNDMATIRSFSFNSLYDMINNSALELEMCALAWRQITNISFAVCLMAVSSSSHKKSNFFMSRRH